MKRRSTKLTLALSAVALIGLCVVPALRAAERKSDQKSEKRPVDPEILRKYDRNANGKLDPDEEAAMRADQEKEKARAKKKKKG